MTGSGNTRLTERDIELFRYLNEQKVMVSSQIYGIFWSDTSSISGTVRQRLTKLIESGYIRTLEVKRYWHKLNLYTLTANGIKALKDLGLDHGFLEIKGIHPLQIEHTLKLVNVRGVMRKLGAHNWRSERVIRKEDAGQGWFPDADLELHGLRIAFELENKCRSKDRHVSRIATYAHENNYTLVIFVVCQAAVMSWLLDLEMPQDKIGFVHYDELIQKSGNAMVRNKSSQIQLGSLF